MQRIDYTFMQPGPVIPNGCLRTQSFTLTATDLCNNSSQCVVTYSWTEDHNPPVFTGCPTATITLPCNAAPTCADALALVTASDECSGSITPSCNPGPVIPTGASVLRALLSRLLTYVTIHRNVWSPIHGPKIITLRCLPVVHGYHYTACNAAPTCADALALVTASDECSGSITPSCNPGPVIPNGCLRTQSFTLTATDLCNNSSQCVVTYSWTEDHNPPVFTGCPTATITLPCNAAPTCADALALVTASDECSGSITPSCNPGPVIPTGASVLRALLSRLLTYVTIHRNVWSPIHGPKIITSGVYRLSTATITLPCNAAPTCADALALVTASE